MNDDPSVPDHGMSPDRVPSDGLSDQDLEQLHRHGIEAVEARRQLALLRQPPPPADLVRAARLGDGIVALPEERWPALEARYEIGRKAGRFRKFVPASGAATRMFRPLLGVLAADQEQREPTETERTALARFVDDLDLFAFAAPLAEASGDQGHKMARLRSENPLLLLRIALTGTPDAAGDGTRDRQATGARGLSLATLPKALVPFHHSSDGPRTPLEEHLREAAEHLLDADRRAAMHFTIPQHCELLFRDTVRAIAARLERDYDARFDISWSIQRPETDTLALDLSSSAEADDPDSVHPAAAKPVRTADGQLMLRPGGHGSLLANLGALARDTEHPRADLVFVRNIDNVLPASRRAAVVDWNRRLGGLLLELEDFLVTALDALPGLDGEGLVELADEASRRLQTPRPAIPEDAETSEDRLREALADLLDRPLRIVGVVEAAGEPGGGPFWVRGQNGAVRPQIVESAQIDAVAQADVLTEATHFNPVHLVCRLRSHRGEAYDLDRFVDPATAFVAEKSVDGRPLRALEHPGLWNGAMAGWNTVFVEVPGEVFAPVKTVFDLLRPEHLASS